MRNCAVVLLILVVLDVAALPQTNPVGTPAFGSFSGGPEAIDLSNLNVHFSIPIVSKPGRGTPFVYNLSYDSWLWTPVQYASWIQEPNWGWRGQVEIASGYISYTMEQLRCDISPPPHYAGNEDWYYYDKITYTGYHDPGGTFHSFGTSAVVYDDNTCSAYGSHPILPYTANGNTSDGSGYTVYVDAGFARKLYPKFN